MAQITWVQKQIFKLKQEAMYEETRELKKMIRFVAYEPKGILFIPLENSTFTAIYYYNKNPNMAIHIDGDLFYLHHTLPAYIIQRGKWPYTCYVGTYDEIVKQLNSEW